MVWESFALCWNRGRLQELIRSVAQLGRVPALGAGCRGFKSHRSDGSRSEPRSGNPYSRRRKRIGPGVGVRGPHLVPLCPKTYARSFPRVGIVRFRAPAFTALNQSSLPSLRLAFIGIACGRFSEYNFPMSLHRSLRSGGSTAAKRNVLKRFERVTLLKKRGQWKAGMKSTGLPKTKPE